MNIYKKTIVSILAIAVVTICISDFTSTAHSNAGGAPTGKTGSPGDGSNCSGCHTGTAVTTTAGLITSTVPVTGYIPGTTYTVTTTIAVAGINKYGFQVSPQNTTGVQKGTLVVTNPTETKLIGTTGKYITHKSTGTAGSGTRTWTFDWTAPAAGSGNLKLYASFIAANGNSANSGDQVFLSSLVIIENLSAGIAESVVNADSWIVYPNPAKDKINLETIDNENKVMSIEVMDITGKQLKTISNEDLSQNQSINIADLQSGVYVLMINTEKGRITKKFIKN
ncbi:hypothetical protein BH10BAC1_BH10BAC1_14870 [soil metagenome]